MHPLIIKDFVYVALAAFQKKISLRLSNGETVSIVPILMSMLIQ